MSETTLKPEAKDMGRVTVKARISNLGDLVLAKRGYLAAEEVRQVDVDDALIDTGCAGLCLPESVIEELGLDYVFSRKMRTANGPRESKVYENIRLEVQDRQCGVEVYAVPDDCPVLIGQIPLEIMDFVVDPKRQQLIGNPNHDGEWVIEAY